jgi:hypothetical protein
MDLFAESVVFFSVFLKILLGLLIVQIMPDLRILGDGGQFL